MHIQIMTETKEKTLILYDLNDKIPKDKTNIIRKLFGYSDKSNCGNYSYERKGLISDIPHERGYKSTLMVDAKYEVQIIDILKQFKLKIITLRLPAKQKKA